MKLTDTPITWNAILAGALTGFGLNFLFNLLSLSIDLSIFAQKSGNQLTFSMPSFLFFIASAILSMFTTGWISGRLTIQTRKKIWGWLYGFLAWTLCFIMTVIIITNMLQFTFFHSSFTSKELVAIRITNEEPMIAETKAINLDMNQKTISMNAQVTLLLFLLGAFSSGMGGYLVYKPRVEANL